MAFLILLNAALLVLIAAIIVRARNSITQHRKNMELLHGMIQDVIAINRSQAMEAEISGDLEQKMKRVKTRLLTDIEELMREFLEQVAEKKD
ncbi:hypothetical protein [Flavobacterium sp.]|uniref:hypothetical protein n=1 Tax=Flavobacterium sp. TaxID=239 RepID=UPI004033361A